jgi:iron complex transport system permease protein
MKSGKHLETSRRKIFLSAAILLILLVVSGFVCLSFGTVNFPLSKIFSAIFSSNAAEPSVVNIIWDIRLPRVLTAMLVGAGLSISGAAFQALLKNPLAEPYILGISSGGAFGAILSLVIGFGFIGTQSFAFLGALMTLMLVYFFGRRFGQIDPTTILLAGVMIGAFFSALILLMISFTDQSLRLALYWLIGNLSFANYQSVLTIFPILIISAFVLVSFSQSYNLISISEENAKQFGVNTNLVKNLTYFIASLLIGIIVSFVGIIGFVGLLIPHICRMIFGNDNKIVLPTSLLTGAIFLVWADLLSRILIPPAEIPIGAITAVLGAPMFIIILKQKKYEF